ncbi:hypothetical protein [Ruegeria sp. EL01]|jgi:hypothetical protein|uniref:hypothetical protein n=1 Tax=Ruegeria sp. EL01 TaxID=2107578 RepID=UPI000EA835B5|nr:hypothetical protein [Ruegeria sp. EL01]
MSAQSIYDTAPLGALIRYSDGTKEPPARHSRKLSDWKRRNGIARLLSKTPAKKGSFSLPGSITLHEGDFTSNGVTCMTFLRTHGLHSALQFEVIDTPKQGMVKILNSSGGNTELLYLAKDQSAADAWLANNRYQNAWCEVVGDDN